MNERYSLEVYDDVVEIYGDLTIEEAFDFLSFFERKGYKSVVLGSENSTLRMMKRDQQGEIVDERITNLKDQVVEYRGWLAKEQADHKKSTDKLKDVEDLMKNLMSEEYKKYKALYDENQKIIRSNMIMQLSDNPDVQKIMEDNFADRKISRPMTQEEKDGAFNELLKIQKDPDRMQYPTLEEYMKGMKNDSTT